MSRDRSTKPRAKAARLPAADNAGFRPWHFFVLASLMAATAGVVLSHGTSPANLVLISLTIGTAGTAALAVYRMLAPLAGDELDAEAGPLGERARATLEREKTLVLRTIKELEFDRAMGKVSAQDFDEMVARLRGRAIALMKQLDQEGGGYRNLIERELLARVGAGPARPSAPPVSAPEAPAAVSGICAACGTANDADARFCKQCGARIAGGQ
jgi:hypothetical protein